MSQEKKAIAANANEVETVKKEVILTPYQIKVLSVNRQLKVVSKSLGYCRKVLVMSSNEIGLSLTGLQILKDSKNKANYEILKRFVKTSKIGNYSPFKVLQAINKHESTLLERFALNAANAASKEQKAEIKVETEVLQPA